MKDFKQLLDDAKEQEIIAAAKFVEASANGGCIYELQRLLKIKHAKVEARMQIELLYTEARNKGECKDTFGARCARQVVLEKKHGMLGVQY